MIIITVEADEEGEVVIENVSLLNGYAMEFLTAVMVATKNAVVRQQCLTKVV